MLLILIRLEFDLIFKIRKLIKKYYLTSAKRCGQKWNSQIIQFQQTRMLLLCKY
jgi:hypothetical protein